METKPARKFGRWLAVLPLAAMCWFIARSCEYGLPNVFFRDHHFTDDRQLTEDVAVDLTKKTLKEEGFDVDSMRPQPFWHNDPQVFARNTINPDNGYVLWGDPHHAPAWEYSVRIEKNGSAVCCRVYRPK